MKKGLKFSDQNILEMIIKGDEKALDYLYKQNFDTMTRLVKSNGGSDQEAKDVFQDALIVFWQKVNNQELTLTAKISTYLYSVCSNLWKKELTRKSRLSYESHDSSVQFKDEMNEQERIITECINQLGGVCKKILQLYYFEQLSMKEISIRLNFANTNTAKTKKYKCKKKLDELVKSKFSASDFLD